MRKLTLIFALGVLVAFPQYAFAQAGSGIEQYEENAPTAGGDRPSGDGQTGAGGGGDGSGLGSTGTGSSAGTESLGSGSSTTSGTGSGDLNAGGTGTRSDASGSRHGDGSRQGTTEGLTSVAAEQGPVSPLGAAEDSPDEGGMGIALPIVLGASLVAALAFLVARHMRRRHAPAA